MSKGPALKMVPIKDESGNVVANRFEPSNTFLADLGNNYVEMRDEKGRVVRANRKLARNGHYSDKGFVATEEPKRARVEK